jgi:poly(A) polymerase
MADTGILDYVLPELCELQDVRQPEVFHKEGDVFDHTMKALDSLPDDPSAELAWAILLHDVGKPETFSVSDRIRFNSHAKVGSQIVETVAKRLNFSNLMKANVEWLVAHHMIMGDILKMKKARQAHWIHHPLFPQLLGLLKADALGTEPQDLSLYNQLKELADEKEKLLPMPQQLITGEEIMKEFGISQGPKVGELLDAVHEAQMEEKIHTSKDAKEYVRHLLNEGE